MEQININIGEVEVPVIIDENDQWFPVSYITTKVLLRSGKTGLINKNNKHKYYKYLRNYKIKYGDKNEQESKCINKIGLIEILKNSQVGRLSDQQIASQDKLHNYLNINELSLLNKKEKINIISIYEDYLSRKIKRLPNIFNKEAHEEVIQYLYKNGIINENNLTIKYLIDELRLRNIREYFSISEIYAMVYGDNFYLTPWRFPKFSFKEIKLDYELCLKIIKNYIKENNIIIKDIFSYDYESLFRKCKINNFTNGNIIKMVTKLYKDKYAGYMFKMHSVNYYKDQSNLLFDLKYLIENDMKLELDKIPLYLTKKTLRNKSNSLYNYIITKRNGTLFEWINKLYPNKFIEEDFEINAYREEFGSDAECFIHELLKDNFKNVIYNQIHTGRTIEINGMIPDWLIISETGVWIVEYFGLYEERQYGKSSRVTEYIDKTKRKIEKYKQMKGYKFIFLYPSDIEDDFRGTRDIVSKMKENPYISMV